MSLPIFRELTADDAESTEIESLCMNCGENGSTRILLTKIPFYKEVILMSFQCEKCGFRNNEIQPGGKIEEKGVRMVLHVNSLVDLNRQVVKSDFTSIRIPELEFEIPSQSQKAEITTVEGVLDHSIKSLEQDQQSRHIDTPSTAVQIDAFIEKMKKLKECESPFTLILEDISGNSYIENINAPHNDSRIESTFFIRTKEQDHLLGIFTPNEIQREESKSTGVLKRIEEKDFTLEDLQGEVFQFSNSCSECGLLCETNMKITKIPHFKEVLIMATSCEHCGHRSNEVKSGGGIEPKGVKIEVQVREPEDFSRDVLKSDTCSLSVPELELDVGPYALSGRFTTVEGLLVSMKEQLTEQAPMFHDCSDFDTKKKFSDFFAEFECVVSGKKSITLVLDDPAGNSYVQRIADADQRLNITSYERTFEHNDSLGINDMKTEDYETQTS